MTRSGWCSRTSRGRTSRVHRRGLAGSCSACSVPSFPSAVRSPSNAMRAADNLPKCTNCSARFAWWSVGTRVLRRLDWTASAQLRLAINSSTRSALEKGENRASNLPLGTNPPRAGLCSHQIDTVQVGECRWSGSRDQHVVQNFVGRITRAPEWDNILTDPWMPAGVWVAWNSTLSVSYSPLG